MESALDWETEIDRSRERHQHIEAVGGICKQNGKNLKYCKPCDMFYYLKETK